MEKVCNCCGIEKPLSEYHNRSVAPDGKDTQCRVCRKKYLRSPSTLELSDDKVRIPAEQVLTALGYELYNEDNPVHEQFIQRIATKYNFK